MKQKLHQCQDDQRKDHLRDEYWDLNKAVKKSARKDKREYIESLTAEAETAARAKDMERLYEITRALAGKSTRPSRPIKDKNGKVLTTETSQRTRWAEHFEEVLNRPPLLTPAAIPPPEQALPVTDGPPTKEEIV
ncbi:hypothetical protein, partial [Acinetobacter baumannii]|uniref:hypothetical protein n=1 Tax=Acinetobacter baumannii TaxID=470 RepID=UPI003397415C